MISGTATLSRADTPAATPVPGTPAQSRTAAYLPVLALGGLALLVRLLSLDHPVFIDELNHVFAARSLLEDGSYAIAGDEPYLRAWIFTRAVAASFQLLGDSLATARLPAVLAGTALVMFMFAWVRTLAGSVAAWCTGLLLCFDPYSLFLSQIVRFYTMQTLAFWIGAACLYHVLDPGTTPRRRLLLAAGGVLGLNLAKHFSALSMIGWIAVAVGFALANHRLLRTWISESRVHAWIAAGLAATILAVGASWLLTGVGRYVRHMFTYADMWAEPNRDYIRYYHEYLLGQYGTVWSILPLVVLAAFLMRPRPTLYWSAIFGTALVLHSLAAWKTERYLFYVMPGFFAITGVAAGGAFTWLSQRLAQAAPRVAGLSLRRVWTPALILLVLLTIRFGWGVNGAHAHTADILRAGSTGKPYPYAASDWERTRPYVQADLDNGAAVVGSANLKSIYSLGRLDYEIAATHLNTVNGQLPEFAVLGKTARPAFSLPVSMDRVMDCHPYGIVVVEEHHWGRDWAVPPATAEFIRTHMEEIPLPAELQMYAFRWRSTVSDPANCPPAPRP